MNSSVGAIIFHKGKYLLQKRDIKKNIFFPGLWGVFGGQKLNKENYLKGIKRELSEELNLEFKLIKPLIVFSYKSKNFKPKRTRYYFECTLPRDFKKKILLREGARYAFFKPNKINNLKIVPWDFAALNYHFFSRIKKYKILPSKK